MHKFWVIFRKEYDQVVRKKTFIVGLFLTPALMAGFMLLPAWFARSVPDKPETLAIIDYGGEGIGQAFADAVADYTIASSGERQYDLTKLQTFSPGDSLAVITTLDSVRVAINNKDLKYCLVIGRQPYFHTDSAYLITNSDDFDAIRRFEARLETLLSTRRLAIASVNLPVDSILALTRDLDLRLEDAQGASIPFLTKYMTALIIVVMMFFMILGYGTMVMRSVIDEKASRIVEVVISSVSPFQLMLGKVLGLGAVTLTSVGCWVLMGAVLYLGSGVLSLNLDPSISRMVFNPLVVVFFGLFLVSGYILYSTLFALIGSIVNTEKDAQNFIMPITMSIMLPVFMAMHVVKDPNSTASLAISFIPIFTPTMMMMRIVFLAPTATHYSLFSGILMEAILGLILVVVTTIGVVWLTGKVFRVGILMYGKRPTLAEIVRWMRY